MNPHASRCTLASAIPAIRVIPVVALVCASLAWSACHAGSLNQRDARAADEWTRTYSLARGGELSVSNRSGTIEVEAAGGDDGDTIEIRAERVVHATSAKTAQDVLPRIRMTEDVKPDKIAIQTTGVEGILVGVSFEVTVHVRVPAWAIVRLQTSAGDIAVGGVNGRVVATTVSGGIKGRNLGGGVETRTVNGKIDIELTALGSDPVSARTTNGTIVLTLPASADANLLATCANGNISMSGLHFEPTGDPGPERGRSHRVRGLLNTGGTPIELQTVNGNITIAAASQTGAQD